MNNVTIESTYNKVADVINKITVSVFGQNGVQGQVKLLGSGIIISNNYILTNLHMVENKNKIYITSYTPQKLDYSVELFRSDRINDLALLKVKNNMILPNVGMIGNSNKTDVGDIVFSNGNAFGKGNLLTSGIIIDKGYSYAANGRKYNSMFRTNINNYPGTCGGPLVNIKGEIIGITNSPGYSETGYTGIGYVTPFNRAQHIFNNQVSNQNMQAIANNRNNV